MARPWLVDTGFGAEAPGTAAWLQAQGVPPATLAGIINTHYHSDHVGGNYWFQTRYGLPIAASRQDAALINRRDPAACAAAWLDQPVEPYHVTVPLAEGDVIDTGTVRVQVIAAPGHTRGQICLYAPEERVLVTGDALHADDVPWINTYGEGRDALEQALATLDRLAGLDARLAVSGHGPPIRDVPAAIAAARRRYEKWRDDPERLAWHACKRIFAYALMIRDGLSAAQVEPYLLGCPWFQAYSRGDFDRSPAAFVTPFTAEMLRAGAAMWRDGRLVARTPHHPLPPDWAPVTPRPRDWPPLPSGS
jgi:hydroxyacylglutathione hydrolase